MASFQQSAGDVQFPFAPLGAPRPDTSKARVIGLLGNLGLQAVEGKISADLVGEVEDPNAFQPTPEDFDVGAGGPEEMSQKDLVTAALNDKELSLRKVALARSQGLISAEEAKTRANMAVQAATARLPGRAQEFRQKAAAFFGDFGEGQGLLNQTAEEKRNASIMQQLTLLALKNGYLPHELGTFLGVQRQFNENKLATQNFEAKVREGTAEANSILNYGVNVANQGLVEFMGEVSGDLANDGLIVKPEAYLQRLAAVKARGATQLQSLMAQSGDVIEASKRSAVMTAYDDYFKPIEAMVASGDMHEIMGKNAKLVKDFVSVDAVRSFYGISVLNAAGGPEAVRMGLETQRMLDKMNPDKRKAHLDINPLQAVFYDAMQQLSDIQNARKDVIDGLIPPIGTWRNAMANTVAKQIILTGDPDDPPTNVAALGHARKAHAAGQTETLDAFADPRAKARQQPPARKETMQWVASNLASLEASGGGIMADDVATELVFENGRFSVQTGAITQRRGGFPDVTTQVQPSADAVRLAEQMNRNLAVLKNYADTPEYVAAFEGKTPEQVFGESFGVITADAISKSDDGKTERLETLLQSFDKLSQETTEGAPAVEALKKRVLGQIKEMAGILLPEADPESPAALAPGLYVDDNGDIFRKTDFGTIVEVLDIGKTTER